MLRAKEIIQRPIFKVGFLVLFLILFFGYIRYNFFARASDEKINIYPQSVVEESNMADLDQEDLGQASFWQAGEKSLIAEAEPDSDPSGFTGDNSATLSFGRDDFEIKNTGEDNISTSTSESDNIPPEDNILPVDGGNDVPAEETTPATAPGESSEPSGTEEIIPAAAPSESGESIGENDNPAESETPPANNDLPASEPAAEGAAETNGEGQAAPEAANHLPQSAPASSVEPESSGSNIQSPDAPAENNSSAPAASSDASPKPDSGSEAGPAALAPLSWPDKLKDLKKAVSLLWHKIISTPKVLAEDEITAASSTFSSIETVIPLVSATTTAKELKDSLVFSDFGLNDYLSESEIINVQLRLSLAAESTFSFDHLLVEYSTGNDWQPAGDLFLQGGTANRANGGYFLYALPIFSSWNDIDNLQIRVSYMNSEISAADRENKGAKIYLDGIWLEVDYSKGKVKGEQEIDQDETEEVIRNGEKLFFGDQALVVDGKEIAFNYTDENTDENLLIKSDQKDYTGLSRAEVYLSVTNQSDQEENFGLDAYFPQQAGDVAKLERLSRRPIAYDEPVMGTRIFFCASLWQAAATSSDATSSGATSSEEYFCAASGAAKNCSAFSSNGKKCRQENVAIGVSSVISDQDQWESADILSGKLADKRNLFEKLLGMGPRKKAVPDNFVAKASTPAESYLIAPGETQYFKMTIKFSPGSNGEFYVETVGDKAGYGLLDPWWNASWDYEVPVSVTYAGGNNLTDFQVPVTINTATLISAGKMKSDCSDIAFADTQKYSDTSQLNYYLEPNTCNKSYTKVWVKVPSLTGNKTIYLYYGNSSATSYSSGPNTFVYFNDFETTNDFTSGSLTLARVGGIAAKYGSLGLESNTVGVKHLGTRPNLNSGRNLIWETWMMSQSSSTLSALPGIEIAHPTGGGELIGYTAFTDTRGTGGTYYLTIRKDFDGAQVIANSTAYTVVTNTWYFLQFTWRSTGVLQASLYAGATTTPYLSTCSTTNTTYTDGEYGVAANQYATWDNYRVRKYASSTVAAALGSETPITNHAPANPSSLAQYGQSTSTPITNGALVAESTVNLQATSTEKDSHPFVVYYQLIGSGSNFTTATSVPASFCKNNLAYPSCANNIWANATTTAGWFDPDYFYRTKITVKASQVGSNLTDFPVYLDLARLGRTDNFWGHTRKNSLGGDLLITNSSGTRMPLEIVRMSTSSKTGETYFRADSLSNTVDTDFYLYYGSSTAVQVASTTTYGSRNVWSNLYKGVWHLSEAAGTTVIRDSTSYNNRSAGAYVGTPTLGSTGRLGTSVYFPGASRINVPKSSSLEPTGNLTFSLWLSRNGTQSAYAKPFWYGNNLANPWGVYGIEFNPTANANMQITSAAAQHFVAATVPDVTWSYLATTYNGTNEYGYLNGAQVSTNNWTGIIGTYDASGLGIGDKDLGGQSFVGYVDELRIASTSRASTWLSTEYNNQNNPSAFFSTTSEQNYLTNSKKAVMIPSVPDSTFPAGYKWQSIACDYLGSCSNWVVFNASTPNFRVDGSAPVFSGILTKIASTTTSIKLGFPSPATEANFSQYKIYYRVGSTTQIHETDSLWSSSSDANLGSQTFNGKSSTTITGLSTSTVYSFSLWAYDSFGHKASTTLIWDRTGDPPSLSFVYAGERTDGTGKADISFNFYHANRDALFKARIDYVLGASCNFTAPSDPTLDETDANTTATQGDPKVQNKNVYQIGTSTGWIITNSTVNTVSFVWFSKTDLPAGNDTYCLRAIVTDGNTMTKTATATLTIDNKAPESLGSLTYSKRTGVSVTALFGAAATDTNFKQYKIFFKSGSSGVRETDSLFSSSSDTALGSRTYSSHASTTVTGLAGATQYAFNIWAYDRYGNKASATAEMTVTTKNVPANASSLGQYRADGVTALSNDSWTSEDEANLYATSTNADGDAVTIYYQLATSSGTYLTATTTPGNACSSGIAYASCPGRVWYSTKATKADLKTIPDGSYKWQALACDTSGGCSRNWVQFNATVPNFKIDTSGPTPPGKLVFNTKGTTNVKFNFGSASVDPNFDEYKIFYKIGTSGVKDTDSLWSSSSAAALGYINYNGKSSTTITGLSTGATYVFNIFAYDTFGHKSTATTEILVSLSDFPAQPFSLIQYKQSTSTIMANGAWTNNSTVNLYATSTSAAAYGIYYELLDNASSFITATSVPATFCYSGTSFAGCTGKIWSNYAVTSGWFDTNYKYRQPITVQASRITGALTNFPVYLDMARLGTANDFWSHTKKNSDGGDILVTNSSGTRMPVEVVTLATSSKTGEVYFRADSISSSSNITFYLYYGSSAATQPASSTAYGARAVWSNNYVSVYHLGNNLLNKNFMDSVGSFNGTNVGTVATTSKFGGANGARTFDGATTAINLGNMTTLTNMTLSAWISPKPTQFLYAKIINKTTLTQAAPYTMYNLTYNGGTPQLLRSEISVGTTQYVTNGTTGIVPGSYNYVASTYDGFTLRLFYNGAAQGTPTNITGSLATNNDPTQIGRAWYNGVNTEFFNGAIDEVRIVTSARLPKWLSTEYNNMNAANTFYSTTSAEEYYLYPSSKAEKVISVPDGSYKWQALACNSVGCSPWAKYNLTTPNFKVDATAPTAPGRLSLVSRKTTSITLGFGAPSVEANFSQYKIFYKQGTSGVRESDTLMGSSSDSSLGYLNYNNDPSITISGLTANTNYIFNIWAYDQAGNKASSTEISFQTANSVTQTYNYTSGVSSGWINPTFAWDSTDDTYAYRELPDDSANDSANYLQGTANNVGASGLSILAVELGLEGYCADPARISYKIMPIFSGLTNGATTTLLGSLFGYSDSENTFYNDITSGLNAPATWTWDDIINLDAKVWAANASSSVANAYVDQIRLRITVDSYPDAAKYLQQYESDATTTIANNSWITEKNIVLKAEATDPDASESLSIYFQYIPDSGTATTSTIKPANACVTGTEYGNCSSKIWVAAYDGVPGDFSVNSYTGTSSIANIPDGDYKWQAMACDSSDICSSWVAFNATTPNIRIDTVDPTVPGDLTFVSRTSGSITLDFGSETVDTNFYRYRIFYIKSSTTPVTEADSEQSDTNLNYINYNGKATTTIAGLAKSSWYTFNIWAYDYAGNKASATIALIASTTSGYVMGQTSYLIENDDGASVNLNTAPGLAGSPLVDVEKGQRLNARIQIQNTGTDQTYNRRFKLQYENNTDAPSTWLDVGLNTAIAYSYGLSGANGDAITAPKAAANGNVWYNGTWHEYIYLTNMYNLPAGDYTEFAFALQTKNATAGKTYRLRLIDGTGSSTFDTYTAYPQITLVAAETKAYSKGTASSLPTSYSGLTYYLDNRGYSDVAVDNARYDSIAASSNYPLYYFSTKFSNATWGLSASWNGQSSVAPSTNPVYLQVYRFGTTNAWVTVASNNSAAADTDFTLSGSVGYLMSQYYDGTYHAYWRVYQASGNETLSTDYYSLSTTTLSAYVSQKHYRWRNDNGSVDNGADWYSASWEYRTKISVQSPKVGEAVTNFPVYVNLADLGTANLFWSHSKKNSDGGDLLITNSVGTRLSLEVVSISTSTKTGEIYFKADALSASANTDFYLYYGNSGAAQPAAGDAYGKYDVWSNGYAGVWHLGETGTGASGDFKNSASAVNNSINTVQQPTRLAAGKLGAAQIFTAASSNHIEIANDASLNPTAAITLSAWFYANSWGDNRRVLQKGATDNQYRLLRETSDANFFMHLVGLTVTTVATSSPVVGSWHYTVGTYDGSSMKLYSDGTLERSTTTTGSISTSASNLFIGTKTAAAPVGDHFDGNMDELRVASSGRTAGWVSTEYNNQNSSATFYKVYLEEATTTATWREAEDTGDPTLGTAITKMANIRLRLSFANTSGGSAANYAFKIQYASTTVNCSTGIGSWYDVPLSSATGHFEMSSSTYMVNGFAVANEFTNSEGYTFVAGSAVARPASTSTAITLAEDNYTEVEYDIRATNAADAGVTYCFRATKNGTVLDAYDRYAELTVAGTSNTAPSFVGSPSDSGSATSTPTTYGSNVTFVATATDAQSDEYYLAICKTSAVTAGNGAAPTCPGDSWCVSNLASSSAPASCTYNTDHNPTESENWYAFACDLHYGAGVAKCSAVSQGQAGSPNASPFRINHPPLFTAISTLNDYLDPGGIFNIQATAADSDTNSSLYYYVCTSNSASFSGCTGGAGNTLCQATATTSANPICHYQNIAPSPSGVNTYFAFVYDNFGLLATSSSRTSSYHINNVAPVIGTPSLNAGNDITLNIKGAADKQVQLISTSVVDQNGCSTLVSAVANIYRNGVGYRCLADDNNCYQLSTTDCVRSDCSGAGDAIATYTCTANFKFFAEPTDDTTNNPWAADNWIGRLQVYDGSNYSATSSHSVEVKTNSALEVPQANINFGTLNPGEDTGTVNQTTNVINYGNSPINNDLSGSDMTGNLGGTIAATYIHWDLTQNFLYSSGNDLENGGEIVTVNLAKPTSVTDVTDSIYWGIGVPSTSTRTYFHGTSTFSAVLNGSGW